MEIDTIQSSVRMDYSTVPHVEELFVLRKDLEYKDSPRIYQFQHCFEKTIIYMKFSLFLQFHLFYFDLCHESNALKDF